MKIPDNATDTALLEVCAFGVALVVLAATRDRDLPLDKQTARARQYAKAFVAGAGEICGEYEVAAKPARR